MEGTRVDGKGWTDREGRKTPYSLRTKRRERDIYDHY